MAGQPPLKSWWMPCTGHWGCRWALQTQVEASRGRLAQRPKIALTHDLSHPWITGARDMCVHNHTARQGTLEPVGSSALPAGPRPAPHLCIHPGVPASSRCSTHPSLTAHLAGSELGQGLSCRPKGKTGEGNGNPLQCYCLENPGDGGAWWAAIYGVTQSRTQTK